MSKTNAEMGEKICPFGWLMLKNIATMKSYKI